MELIGAGCGRTGTLSLKTALEILGLPTYHMVDVVQRGDVGLWLDAAEGKPLDPELTAVLSNYKALCDWPCNFFYKQLMEAYPDAKVILTVRDPVRWYDSVKETVWEITKAMEEAPCYVRWLSGFMPPGRKMLPMLNKIIWEGLMQGTFSDPQAAQQRFLQWNEEVQQHVPPERLLVFEVKQGWGPLCAFLGKPVPEEPFPHVNDTQHFRDIVAFVRRRQTVIKYGLPVVAAGVAAGLVMLLTKSRRR